MANLNDIALFSKVAESGSYARACDYFDIPKATLSRRIKALEEALGVRLINRNTRKFSLTEAGLFLLSESKPMIEGLENIERAVSSFQDIPSGNLRVTIPVEIGIKILNDIICRFSKRYPLINLDINLTNDLIDIVEEGYDLAIRGGALKDSNLVSRKIMSTKLHLCCTPEYLTKHGTPGHPEELIDHVLIFYPTPSAAPLRLSLDGDSVGLQGLVKFKTNSLDLVLKAALGGLGIGVLPSSVCSADVKSGRLVTLFEEWKAFDIGLYALYQDRKTPKKVDLFLDFLAQELAEVQKSFI